MSRSVTPPKRIEQRAGEYRQDDDAVGIDKAAPAKREDVREIVVVRDGAAEARKIGERGVGGKREDQKDRGDGEVIEKAAAEDGGDEHETARSDSLGCSGSVAVMP